MFDKKYNYRHIYIITIIINFCLFYLLSINQGFAQKELYITTSAGWKVSYNELLSDKPLPTGMAQYSNWSGFSSALGLEYKFNPHWGIHAQVKTASVEIGVRTKLSVKYDTLTTKYSTFKGGGASSKNGHAPAHIQIGGTYYSKPLVKEKFCWLFGGGVAYLINRDRFTPGIEITSSAIQQGYSRYYGREIGLEMVEDYTKNGILLNIHAGLNFNFLPKHHLLLTLQHNEGIRNIWQFKSNQFYYVDKVPYSTTFEHFDVKIRTKGSYSALQLGYKYALFSSK